MAARVLIAYDGSEGAEAAVATAGRLFAGAHGRVLTIVALPGSVADVQALGFALDAETLQRSLESLSRKLMEAGSDIAAHGVAAGAGAGLTLEPFTTPREGAVWQTIISAADAVDADVIVCGSRGRGGVARSLLGSTSTSVLHHATRPVLVVPDGPAVIDGSALIAYDGSPGARAAIAAAGRLLPDRPVVVVHVWYSPMRHTLSGRALAGAPLAELREFATDYDQYFADAAASVAQEGVARAREAGLDASGQAIESDSGAWRALAEAATDHHAAVLVCGSRGRGGVAAAVLGSVSSGLVHNAQMPALIVRPDF
jgi:nucleotide-binding universal stress UspA family protein